MRGNRTNEDVKIERTEEAEELSGKLEAQSEEQKLMRSVLENDEQTIEEGRVVQDALNAGVGNFSPDIMFEKLVKNYEEATELYGETILREATGYEPSELERNIRLPEFKRMLKEEMTRRLKRLQERGVLDQHFGVTDQGFLLAALVLIKDELEYLQTIGFGAREQKERLHEHSEDLTRHKRSYREFAVRKTLHVTAKRGHSAIEPADFRFRERASEGKLSILYAVDCSGSMKGKKLALAKRAGVALAYKAMEQGDDVGLLAFGAGVQTAIPPRHNFMDLVKALTLLRARAETDIASAIRDGIPLLHGKSKHLLLLTDGLHTTGSTEEVLAAAQEARDADVSLNIVGINLDAQGEAICEQIIDISGGIFYRVQNVEELDLLILEDYARLKRGS